MDRMIAGDVLSPEQIMSLCALPKGDRLGAEARTCVRSMLEGASDRRSDADRLGLAAALASMAPCFAPEELAGEGQFLREEFEMLAQLADDRCPDLADPIRELGKHVMPVVGERDAAFEVLHLMRTLVDPTAPVSPRCDVDGEIAAANANN